MGSLILTCLFYQSRGTLVSVPSRGNGFLNVVSFITKAMTRQLFPSPLGAMGYLIKSTVHIPAGSQVSVPSRGSGFLNNIGATTDI